MSHLLAKNCAIKALSKGRSGWPRLLPHDLTGASNIVSDLQARVGSTSFKSSAKSVRRDFPETD